MDHIRNKQGLCKMTALELAHKMVEEYKSMPGKPKEERYEVAVTWLVDHSKSDSYEQRQAQNLFESYLVLLPEWKD